MKVLKGSGLIVAISLMASFFSCTLDAMIARRPQGVPLSMKRRQDMLTNLKASGVQTILPTPQKVLVEPYIEDYMGEDLVDISSCEQNDIVVHQEGLNKGFCISLSVAQVSNAWSNMIKDMSSDENPQKKIIIPLEPSTIIIKNTLAVLELYEKNQKKSEETIKNVIKSEINHYGIKPLADLANYIFSLECPQVIESAFLDVIKIKYKGDLKTIVANKELNPDLRRLFIVQPTIDMIRALLERKNIEAKGRILQDYSTFVAEHLLVGINGDGTKIVEAKRNSFIVRDALNTILMEQDVGFPITAIAVSPDGARVAIGGTYGSLIIWDIDARVKMHDCVGHSGVITSIAFSSDGANIVSGSTDIANNLIVWDTTSGRQSLNIAECPDRVFSVAFNGEGTKVVAGCGPYYQSDNGHNKVVVWDAGTGSRIKNYFCNERYIYSVAFSHDEKNILYVGSERPLVFEELLDGIYASGLRTALIDTATGACKYLKKSNDMAVRAIFTPDNRKIIVGEINGIHIFDIDSGYNTTKDLYLETGHKGHCLTSMAISANGRKMVFGYGSKYQGDFPALLEYTFLTDQDEVVIDWLKKNAFAQELLVWKLCSQLKEQGAVDELSEEDILTFLNFPKYIQQILSDIFWPKVLKFKE